MLRGLDEGDETQCIVSNVLLKNPTPDPFQQHDTETVLLAVALKFCGGVVIWLDILAAITSGTTPVLMRHQHQTLGHSAYTKLEEITGCKSWVMAILSRIAVLHEARRLAPHCTQTDMNSLIHEIKQDIFTGLTAENLGGINITDVATPSHQTTDTQHNIITRIFANAALVYAQLIIDAFETTREHSVEFDETIGSIKIARAQGLLRALVFPLFMMACVAKAGYEQKFFDDIFSSQAMSGGLFRYRRAMLDILRRIWGMREIDHELRWLDVLEDCKDLLLV